MRKTTIDLGREKRLQYPGEFEDLTDRELGEEIKSANPDQYGSYESLGPMVTPENLEGGSHGSGPLEMLDFANKKLSFLSNPASKHVYAPVAEGLTSNPAKKEKLKALQNIKGDEPVYPSDVGDILMGWDNAPKYLPVGGSDPNLNPKQRSDAFDQNLVNLVSNTGKFATRMGEDVLGDPLSWLNFGGTTKLGRVAESVNEARQAKIGIKLDSKLAKDASNLLKKPVSPQLIKDLKKMGAPGKTFAQQVAGGQRSVADIGLPFSESLRMPLPGMTGKGAALPFEALSGLKSATLVKRLDGATRQLLGAKSGDPEFDALFDKARDLIHYRANKIIQGGEIDANKVIGGKILNKNLGDLSRELGIPREELNKQISGLVENAIGKTKKGQIKNYGQSAFDDIYDSLNDKMIDAKVELVKAQQAGNQPEVEKWAKQVVDLNSDMNIFSGKYSPPPSIHPKVDAIVKQLREQSANQLLREGTSGLRAIPLLADRDYIAHVMTPTARDLLRKQMLKEGVLPKTGTQRELSTHMANYIRRQFVSVRPNVIRAWKDAGLINGHDVRAILSKTGEGVERLDKLMDLGKITDSQYTDAVHTLSIDEVNKMPATWKEKIFGTKDIDEIFHTDPVYSTTVRGVRGETARTWNEFFTELKTRDIVRDANTAPADWVAIRNSELKGLKAPPEIAQVLDKIHKFNTDSEDVNFFLKAYDKYFRLHKLWTLAPFPAYHTMNMVGNFWNNFLAGVKNPLVYVKAALVQNGKDVRIKDVFGNIWDSKKLLEETKKLGVIDKGLFSTEIHSTIKNETQGGKLLTLSSRNHALRWAAEKGRNIEDNARLAHFIDRLQKGDTPERAALSVKKFLFDYGDLSDAERNILNRGFFFYTWTRKNLPLQIHGLINKPGVYRLPFEAKHEIKKEVPSAPEKYLADYMKSNFPIRIKYNSKTGKYTYFMLNRWLPAADLLKLSQLHDIALNMVTPIPKELAQRLWNIDFYTKQPIEKYKNEPDNFLGVKMRKKDSHALKNIRLLNEIDKMTKKDSDLFEQIIGILSGKTYEFDPVKGIIGNKARVDEDMSALKAGISRSAMKGDTTEVRRIVGMIQEKAGEY